LSLGHWDETGKKRGKTQFERNQTSTLVSEKKSGKIGIVEGKPYAPVEHTKGKKKLLWRKEVVH